MLHGAIAYQVLRRENPATIVSIRGALEKHPWYESHWKDQLDRISEIDRDEQLKYIEMIINLTPRGYMIYNLMPSVNPLSLNEFSSIISQTKKIRIEREFPSTGDDNYTIIWHP